MLLVLVGAAAEGFGAAARQGQVYVARDSGIVNNQCAGAVPVTQFSSADTTIYLYAVIDNVQSGEALTVLWESPSGAGDSINAFAPLDRAYTSVCFSDSLTFPSGFPAGAWKVHLLWNSAGSSSEIATVPFLVTASGGSGGGAGVSINFQTVLQQANLQPGTYTNAAILAAQGLTIVPNPAGTPGAAGTGQLQISPVSVNEVHPPGTATEAQLNGPGIGYNILNCTTFQWTGNGRLTDFTITRPGMKNGSSMPAWAMYALDSTGVQLARTGEGNLDTGAILMPADYKSFTISSIAAMDRVVFCSRNAGSTYNALPLSGGSTAGGGTGGGGTGGGGTITTLTGTWQLTATGCNFVASPGTWQATLSLTEASGGALSGTVVSNTPPIGDYATVPPTIGSGSKRSGNNVELHLTPSGWISTFEFKGTISGSQITGTVSRNGATACTGGFTLGGGSTGGGGAPGISVSPSSLNFDLFNVGQSLDKTVVITNTGTAALTVTGLSVANLTGGNFTLVSPGTPFTVGVNGQQTVTVRFTPQAAGTSNGRLTITSNAKTSPTLVSLTGTGVTTGGGGTNCAYNVPAAVSVPAAGLVTDSILFRVDTSPDCTWTASRGSSDSWITITSPAAGATAKGSGAVLVSIPANPGPVRSGAITITGTDGPHTVRVSQNVQSGPVISAGGVVNAASYASATPPDGGVAQGSYMSIFGSGLGPNQPVLADAAPASLKSSLGGVSIKLTSGNATVEPLPTFVASSQINAIVTSDAPLGNGQLTVTYNGVTSAAAPVRIVRNALGIFTMGSTSTAGIIQTFPPWAGESERPLNTRTNSAAPGDYGIVWATGLGANVVNGALLSDSQQPQPNGMIDVPITITLGGVRLSTAQIPWLGRSGYNGVDNVYFIVPEGVPSGCAVPVQIQVGDFPANTVTIAIDQQRRPCSE